MSPSLLAALAPIIWGTTFVCTALYLSDISPVWVSVERMLPAGLLVLLLNRWRPTGAWWWRTALIGSIGLGLFSWLLFIAAQRLPGGVAGTLCATLPLQMMLARWLVHHHRPRLRQFLAAALGLSGVALMTLQGAVTLDMWGVAAALLSSSCIVTAVLLTAHWGVPKGHALGFAGWQMIFAGILLLPLALWLEGMPGVPSSANLTGLLWMALPGTVMAYGIWVSSIPRVEPVTLAFLNLLNPVVALTLAALVLMEQMSALQWLGVGLVFTGLVLAQGRLPARQAVQAQQV